MPPHPHRKGPCHPTSIAKDHATPPPSQRTMPPHPHREGPCHPTSIAKDHATPSPSLVSLQHDCSMAAAWLQHGCFMAASWLLHGCFMAASWLQHGYSMTSSSSASLSSMSRISSNTGREGGSSCQHLGVGSGSIGILPPAPGHVKFNPNPTNYVGTAPHVIKSHQSARMSSSDTNQAACHHIKWPS